MLTIFIHVISNIRPFKTKINSVLGWKVWIYILSYGKYIQTVSCFFLVWFCINFFSSLQNADSYKSNSGAKSEARMPAVYRAHHNARILCVMEHPTLKMRQNASLLLDVQCKYYIHFISIVRQFFFSLQLFVLICLKVLHFFL